MNRNVLCRLAFGASFAFWGVGCNVFQEPGEHTVGKTSYPRFDNRLPVTPLKPAETPASGLVQAGATTPPTMLPPPTPAPLPPSISPPVALPTALPPGMPTPSDPHMLSRPTATGGLLQLAPGEAPMDRAVDLVRRIEEANADNKVLLARVRSLEAKAAEREQAISESLREVDAAAAEVAKTRAELAAMRKEIAALKQRMQQMEQEETETLKLLIEAIDKLNKPPGEGKK